MAAITAYFDDSGTHGDSHTVVIAGFVAPYPRWKRFIREWNKAKLEYGFSAFHFTEFMSNGKNSEFADVKSWNDQRKARVLARLRYLAFTHAVHAFSISVTRKDYDDALTEAQREEFGGHFTWAVRSMLGFVEKWRLKQKIDEPIEYIFSVMDESCKREIDGLFEAATKLGDSLNKYGIQPGCHSYRNMRDILPLQAADLLAGCVYQADKVRLRGAVIPQYVADTFNYFVLKTDFFDSKFQMRDSLLDVTSKSRHLSIPENRKPKPTPKGTKPNPSSKQPKQVG